MSRTYISAELRRHVALRAELRCEYCRIAEDDTVFGCQVDHIISEKHGGLTTADNLAYACTFCNQHKGSDIASLTTDGSLVRLFNPRIDSWQEHFAIVGLYMQARTPVAEATIRLLGFNTPERVLEREALSKLGRFPF
ncbi:HNH endonuclease [Hymenobacter weizhouensis]|uniref:HNH endonuclease n=1 Tax=Hymenobacter sp. YIM 151500-1 TaxID=2987689 RepID=UPI00222770E3|nr:HNH endonuclease signature motif containing protein [Hymenobacter sp. YIM 151500-1]UYZ61666.1 HNH endonuclease [Hymenobacter sp. YIM 151500-1]